MPKATAAKKTVKKTETKKAKVKKGTKKTAQSSANGKIVEHGFERKQDLPWNDKKVKIFRALKQMRATTAMSARGTDDVAKKAGVTGKDVRHYCYHARAAKLCGIADREEIRGYAFYLTATGAKVDLVKALKEQNDKKKKKAIKGDASMQSLKNAMNLK